MRNFVLLLFVVFLCFTNCKKENISENLYYSDTLISQINSGKLAIHGFTYNSSYLIHETTEPFVYRKFSYDSQNVLKKVELAYSLNPMSCVAIPGQSLESDPRKAKISDYSEFEYDSNLRLVKKSKYFINSGASQLMYYQLYEYENELVVKLSTFNAQGKLTDYHNYLYDDRGNITRDDQYTCTPTIKLISTVICEFDNKINPYRVFVNEGNPGMHTNRNNIITETSISYYGSEESRNVRSHTYEYNDSGLPVKIDKLDCLYGK